MKSRTGYFLATGVCLSVFALFSPHLYAGTGETTVEIHNVDDRVRATVTSPKPEPVHVEVRSIEKPILAVEDTTIGMAGKSTKLVGKGTDVAVDTVQKFGDSFFARFFKMLDFSHRNKQEKK